MLTGLLNLDKPAGMTSRDVVDRVEQVLGPSKAGHAGTLDPLATGVLVVCLGGATRLIEYVQRMRKNYRGTFLLGRRSDTDDVDGKVEELPDAPAPTREQIEAALPAFRGSILQAPPAYSAVKIAGRRAYERARRGESVAPAPRTVEVHRLEIAAYAYPELTLDIECGSGTYVRSLGRDLAAALGTAAVMSALVREAIGSFRRAEACTLDQLAPQTLDRWLLPPRAALADLPSVPLGEEALARLAKGLLTAADGLPAAGTEVALYDAAGRLAGIAAVTPAGLKPVRNLGR